MLNRNYTERRGDTKSFDFEFTNDDGDPVDLSGWTIVFALKENRNDPDSEAVIKKSESDHGGAPDQGTTSIVLSSDDMDIDAGKYHYAFRLWTDDDQVHEFQTGIFTIKEPVVDEI